MWSGQWARGLGIGYRGPERSVAMSPGLYPKALWSAERSCEVPPWGSGLHLVSRGYL